MSTCRTSSTVQALAEVDRWIALDSHEPDAYARLAEVLNYAGQPEKAIGLVEKAMRLNPQKPGWYSGVLGWTDQLLGRYEKAIAPLAERDQPSPPSSGVPRSPRRQLQ